MTVLKLRNKKREPDLYALPRYIGGNFINPLQPPNISYPPGAYSFVVNTNSIITFPVTNSGGPIVSFSSNPNINPVLRLNGIGNLGGDNALFNNVQPPTNYTINAMNAAGTGSTIVSVEITPTKFMFFNQFNKHLTLRISSSIDVNIPTGSAGYRVDISSSADSIISLRNPSDNGFIHVDFWSGTPSADFTSVSWSLNWPNLAVGANTLFDGDQLSQFNWVAVTVHNVALGPTIVT